MDIKSFLKDSFTSVLVRNILLAIGAIIVVGLLALLWLRVFTRHGKEEVVPNLIGAYVEEGIVIAEQEGLTMMVVDTIYDKNGKLGSIVDQRPVAGLRTKEGRAIYVTINAKTSHPVALPKLTDLSYRQAEAILRTIGLGVSDVQYRVSEYKDMVLDVLYNGQPIVPGTRLLAGQKVALIVGSGRGEITIIVPSLNGLTRSQASSVLQSHNLMLGGATYREERTDDNENAFVVYSQWPEAGMETKEGSSVTINLSTDPVTAQLEEQAAETKALLEDEFFD